LGANWTTDLAAGEAARAIPASGLRSVHDCRASITIYD
jgi:hypothetical protein